MADHEENVVIDVEGDISDFDKSMKKLSKSMDKVSKNAAKVAKVSGAVFVGMAAGIGVAITAFSKFEDDMLGVKTLLDDDTFQDVGKSLDEGFRQMSADTLKVFGQIPIALDKATKGMFDLVSAGVPASKATDTLAVAAKLAIAGLTDVSTTVDGLTSVMNAYGLEAEDAEKISGKFFLAQKAGKTTIAELARGFGQVGSSANALGVSFEEVLSVISATSLAGIKTSEAYTGLKAVLTGIAKPTSEAAEEAERLQVAFGPRAIEEAGGFEAFLNNLTTASGFSKDSLVKLFGSVEAVNTMFALTGGQAEAFSDVLNNLNDDTKAVQAVQKAYETQVMSLSNQFKLLTNRLKKIFIEIGKRLEPIFKKMVAVGHEIIDIWDNMSEGAKNVAVTSGFLTTALSGIVTVVATILAVLPSIIKGFLLLKGAIAKVIASKAFISIMTAISAAITSLGAVVIAAIIAMVAAIVTLVVAWNKNWGGIQEKAAGVLNVIEGLWYLLRDAMSDGVDFLEMKFAFFWDNLKYFAGKATDAVLELFNGMFEAIVATVDFVTDKLKEGFEEIAGFAEDLFGFEKGTIEKSAEEAIDTVIDLYEQGSEEKKKILDKEAEDFKKAEDKKVSDFKKAEAKKRKAKQKEDKKSRDEKLRLDREAAATLAGAFLQFEKDSIRQAQRLQAEADELEKQMQADKWGEIGSTMETAMSGGMQAVIGNALGDITNIFLPGMGGAVTAMFNMLSQDSDAFIKQFTSMFSSEFLNNIEKNIIILIEKLPEIIPPFIQALIEASPRIAGALIKAFTDPNFIKEMAVALSYAFVEGIITALKQTRDSIAQAFSFDTPKWLNDFVRTANNLFSEPPWLEKFRKAVNRMRDPLGISSGGGVSSVAGVGGFSVPFLHKGKSPDVKYLANGFTPRGMDRIPAMIGSDERLFSGADNRTLIKTMNDIKNAISGGQNFNLTFSGDGIQELIERSLVEITALGTGRVAVNVGSES